MRWSERQVAMLAEMGIAWQQPPESSDGDTAVVEQAVAASEAIDVSRQAPSAPPTQGVAEPSIALVPAARGVARVDIATLDWPALREAVVACRACKLCDSRRQTVFGIGNESADWMIVGEAPGEQEDRQGEPFVGKSGQLLDNMLRAIGLTRGEAEPTRQVFIVNTLKCRPPGNRNPEPEELAQCESFLIRQIQLVRPKIILAMGAFAVQSLLRSTEPVGRLRGRVHHYQGVPLIVSYHPAYLLRNPGDKAKAWDDLCLAMETMRQGLTSPTSAP